MLLPPYRVTCDSFAWTQIRLSSINIIIYILEQVCVVRETNLTINSKIIMITDGEPTEIELVAGPDVMDSSKVQEVCNRISHIKPIIIHKR